MSEFKPRTRKEAYWGAMSGDYTGEIPKPQTTEDCYLAAMSGNFKDKLPNPTTRLQKLMRNTALKGGVVQNVEFVNGISSFVIGNYKKILKQITIPYGVTELATSCFSECVVLEKVIIPDTVALINGGAFNNCTQLKKIDIPGSVKTICSGAFNACTELKEIKLNEGVETIQNGAFAGCVIESIKLPQNSQPAEKAFDLCNNLTDIYVPWAEGEVANAPWGATNATIHYNCTGEEI